jgi:hypothetical protein
MSFEIGLRDLKILRQIDWSSIVVDKVRNLEDRSCELIKKMTEQQEQRAHECWVLLSDDGDRLQKTNNPSKLWSLLRFLSLPGSFEDGPVMILKNLALEKNSQTVNKLRELLAPLLLCLLKKDVITKHAVAQARATTAPATEG